jgi:hypothetical protein
MRAVLFDVDGTLGADYVLGSLEEQLPVSAREVAK